MQFKKLKPGVVFIFRPKDHQERVPLFFKTKDGDAVNLSDGTVIVLDPKQDVLEIQMARSTNNKGAHST